MKLHIPVSLRRAILAAFAFLYTVSPSYGDLSIRGDSYKPGYYAKYGCSKKTLDDGSYVYTDTYEWESLWTDPGKGTYSLTLADGTQKDVRYNKQILFGFGYVYSRDLSHSCGNSTTYTNNLHINEDGGGRDRTWQCTSYDSEGNIVTPGYWILADTDEAKAIFTNFGDMVINDSRQQRVLVTIASAKENADGTIDYEYVRTLQDATNNNRVIDGVHDVSFSLAVTNSTSFTYNRGYTAGDGAFLSGSVSVLFDNLVNLSFTNNTAKYGSIVCAAQSSVWSGDHTGGFHVRNISGTALFSNNVGSLFHNTHSRYEKVHELIFSNNVNRLFDSYNAPLYTEFDQCDRIVFSGNGHESAESIITNTNHSIYAGYITFENCGEVIFSGNIMLNQMFDGATPKFTNVGSVKFIGNTVHDGYLIHDIAGKSRTLYATGISDTFAIDNNILNHSSGYGAISNTDMVIEGSKDKHGKLFSVSGNEAYGGFYSCLMTGDIAISYFDKFCANENYINSETDALLGDLAMTDVNHITFNDNVLYVDSGCAIGGILEGYSSVNGFSTLEVKGNEIGGEIDVEICNGLLGNITITGNDEAFTTQNSAIQIQNNIVQGMTQEIDERFEVANVSEFTYKGNAFVCDSTELAASGTLLTDVRLNHVGQVIVENNLGLAYNGRAYGGALGGVFNVVQLNEVSVKIQNSKNVLIQNNAAVGTVAAFGGAITAPESVYLSGNESVTITGNYAKADTLADMTTEEGKSAFTDGYSYTAYGKGAIGGAIYLSAGFTTYFGLAIYGNDAVTIRGNYITDGKTYHLQGIASGYGNFNKAANDMLFAANENKTVELYDPIYTCGQVRIGITQNNIDEEPYWYSAEMLNKGKVVFSGAYAQQDLSQIKGDAQAGAVTAAELEASRTSIVEGGIYLNGGSLEVRDKAILKTSSIRMKDNTSLIISSGSSLSTSIFDPGFSPVLGTISAHNVKLILDGGTFHVTNVTGLSGIFFADTHKMRVISPSVLNTNALYLGEGSSLELVVSSANTRDACLTLNFSDAQSVLLGYRFASAATLVLETAETLGKGQYKLLHIEELTDASLSGGFYDGYDWTQGFAVTGLGEGNKLEWIEHSDKSMDLVWTIGSSVTPPVTPGPEEPEPEPEPKPDEPLPDEPLPDGNKTLTWTDAKKAVWQVGSGGWVDEQGKAASFSNESNVQMGDGTVTIVGEVAPGEVYLAPSKSLTFKTKFDKKTGLWSGAIAGEDITLTIAAGPKGKVTMNDGNTYTGETIIESGTVSVVGVDSFGESDITISGGTLDLKSKAVDNAITLTDSAAIKGGAKYVGEFTLNGGELQKGSVLNVADTAILAGGVMNGTLSGTGIVYVTGDVQLGDAAKLATNGLDISGTLNVGSKGLAMNAKSSAITISGGTLESEGKLSAASLTMVGGALDVSNAKPMTVTLTGVADLSAGATVDLYGAFTAADLDMNDATFTLSMDDGYVNQPKPQNITLKDKNATSELSNDSTLDVMGSMSVAGGLKLSDSTLSLHDWDEAQKPKAQTLTVKGALEVSDSALSLNGKLTAASLAASGTDIKLENTTAAQSIALTLAKDTQKQVVTNTLTGSTMDVTGGMTVAGALELTDSSISLHDVDSAAKPKAMGLTVKDALSIADTAKDAATELALTGKLSALSLTATNADIKLLNTTAAQSITLSGKGLDNTLTNSTLTANGSMSVTGNLGLSNNSTVILGDMAKGKPMGLTIKGALSINEGAKDEEEELYLTGKLAASSLSMQNADITIYNDKAVQSVTLSGKGMDNTLSNSTLYAHGSMSVTGRLEATNSQITLIDASQTKPKAMGLSAKSDLVVEDTTRDADYEIYLTGKLSAASLRAKNAEIWLINNTAAQSVALSGKDGNNVLEDSSLFINGSMSVTGHLALSGASYIYLQDDAKGKAMNLAVKGDLTLGSGSSLTLSGALSAANMTLNGGSIYLTSTKLQAIKVSKELTFGGSITLGLQEGLDIKMGKSYNLFTYKTLVGVDETTNLYTLLGLEDKYCTLTLDSKKKAITLMVTEEEWSKWVSDHAQTTAEVSEVATASIAEDAAPMTTSAVLEEEQTEEKQEVAIITTLPVAQAVDVEELIAKVSDTLVQTTWGTAKASRAFVDSIANRGQNATALAEGRGAAWGGVIGATSRLSSHGGSLGADHTLSGAVFGAEMNAGVKHSLGMAMGVTWGEINTLSAYNVDQDSTHFALYGQSRLMQSGNKGLTLDWSAAYGRSENDADMLGSSYDWTQHALQLDARLTYGYALNERTTLRGFGGVQYLHIDSDTPEKGVKADSMQNVRVEVGVGATYMATAKTAVYGEVSFIGDMVRDNPATHIGGVCRGGSNPGRAGMNLSVGATHALNESWSLNASYNMELQPRANAHNANIGATYRF